MRATGKYNRIILGLFLSVVPAAWMRAAPPEEQNKDVYNLDLESLLKVKVITASKFAQSASDAPGIISVLTEDDIRRYGGITLREVLQRVPGIAPGTQYLTDRSVMSVRGDQVRINGGHILFLINGRPTREVLEGGLISDLLESFPIAALQRIEVIKGPGSVLYGSDAFSAVVNLITKAGSSNSVAVTGFGGRMGARGSSMSGSYRRGNLGIMGAAQMHDRVPWKAPFTFTDPNGQLSSEVVAIQDRGKGAYLEADYRGLRFMTSFSDFEPTSIFMGYGKVHLHRGFADLGYQGAISDKWDVGLNLTYTRNTLLAENFASIRRDSNEALLEWTNHIEFNERNHLTFGALTGRARGAEDYFGSSPDIRISWGSRGTSMAYAQFDHKMLSRLKLVGGIQANKIGALEWNLVPRGGLLVDLSKRVVLKALYSKAYRAPSLNETGLRHPQLYGTSDLRPERVGTFDLQLAYTRDRLYAAATYFHSRQTDIINYPITVELPYRYANIGIFQFTGFELEGRYRAHQHVTLDGSTSYQRNTDQNGRKSITPVANWSARGGASYETQNGLSASVFNMFQGAVPMARSVLNPPAEPYHMLSSHVRWDLSRRIAPDSRTGVALFAHADNLLNQKLWFVDWGSMGDTLPVNRGRTIYFGVEFQIKGD